MQIPEAFIPWDWENEVNMNLNFAYRVRPLTTPFLLPLIAPVEGRGKGVVVTTVRLIWVAGQGILLHNQIRQVELQFTVGEALSCVGAGRQSEVARDPWTLQQPDCGAPGNQDNKTMQGLIEMIVTKYANSDRNHVRKVGVQLR